MATPDFSVVRPGQSNGNTAGVSTSAVRDALFYKLFSNEVMVAYESAITTGDLGMTIRISGGKSKGFPILSHVGAGFHVPGVLLLGTQATTSAEREIGVDQLVVSDISIDRVEELMNAYEVRSIYSGEIGAALAFQMEKNKFITAIRAARSGPVLSGTNPRTSAAYPGGSQIANTSMNTDADVLRNAILTGCQKFDEKAVPAGSTKVYLRPAQYWLLVQDGATFDTRFGGSGAISTGQVGPIGGVSVQMTNNLPNTAEASASTVDPTSTTASRTGTALSWYSANDYSGNFINTTALMVRGDGGIGNLMLLDVAVEGQYYLDRKATLLTAHYAAGHGVLRPEKAIELCTTAYALTTAS